LQPLDFENRGVFGAARPGVDGFIHQRRHRSRGCANRGLAA
jgi:hypothetical protein